MLGRYTQNDIQRMSWHCGTTHVVQDVSIVSRIYLNSSVLSTSSRKLYRIRKTTGKAKTGKMAGPEESKGSAGPSARMPFITSSNVEKADPATRKLIRSHVMRGKKKKGVRFDKGQRTTSLRRMAGRTQAARVKLEEVIEMYAPQVPGRVGSDLSFVEFADEIEPSIRLNMIKSS